MKVFRFATAILFSMATAGATGWFGPMVYLDEGGRNVAASPEFFWDLELKRIAREFHAPEKLLKRTNTTDFDQITANADANDFDDAVKNGAIKPPNIENARKAHITAREAIDSSDAQPSVALPDEFASEFADYHKGAFAYRHGAGYFSEARDAWLALLKRQPQERHYRSTWAAFMLGRLAIKTADPEASKWFQRTRELAREGFADSLGFAADSYGWEGRAEWKHDRPGQAARLFLTQLALGDESAVVSIKALIPDRQPVPGMLNYNIVEPQTENDAWEPRKKFSSEEELAGLERAAQDPLLRRLVTAHIVATASTRSYFSVEAATAQVRARRWLEIVKRIKLQRVEDAEYLGWAAYIRGDYSDAAHWLKLSTGTSPAALWLQAKLDRRDGHLAEAVKAMAEAWKTLRDERAYTGWRGESHVSDYFGDDGGYIYRGEQPAWSLSQEASGDFAAFYLQRADFIQALDLFLKGNLWNDAAYVAERVLTTDELKRFVDDLPQPTPSPAPSAVPNVFGWQNEIPAIDKLRYLLGRRLVREKHHDEAARYLRPPFDQVLRRYVEALRKSEDRLLPKKERALALFRAAWIARHDGMEIMGTEMAPDGFSEGGNFPVPDLATQRVTGKATEQTETGEKVIPAVLKASREETGRLGKTAAKPDVRFHYRVVAGTLAITAAALLPDNAEETADVINTAGLWTKEQDEKLADKYFDVLEKRGAKTSIGRAAIARRWFVDTNGPWSTMMKAEEEKMRKEIGLQDVDEAWASPSPSVSPEATP